MEKSGKKRNGQEEERRRRSELKITSKRMKDQIEDYYYKLKWLWKRQKNRETKHRIGWSKEKETETVKWHKGTEKRSKDGNENICNIKQCKRSCAKKDKYVIKVWRRWRVMILLCRKKSKKQWGNEGKRNRDTIGQE